MAITFREAGDDLQKEWDDVVQSSSHGTIFHTWKWLTIVRKQTKTRFLPLMAYRGNELVALYPIFIQKRGILTMAFSPPSQTYLVYLGPVIRGYDALKQDKKESLLIELQEGVDKVLSGIGCNYIRIRSPPGIYDSRYLSWAGFTVGAQYTYRIQLSKGIDNIWAGFDKKLRMDINKAEKAKIEVKEGNLDDLLAISENLSRRFQEQGLKKYEYKDYLTDLYHAFYPENLKIFAGYFEGERIGGMVAPCFNGTMYGWIGIPKSDFKGPSPNDFVQWEAIKWACRNGFTIYDIMSAGDNPRLRYFKSKYNPDLCIWYTAQKYSPSFLKLIDIMSQ